MFRFLQDRALRSFLLAYSLHHLRPVVPPSSPVPFHCHCESTFVDDRASTSACISSAPLPETLSVVVDPVTPSPFDKGPLVSLLVGLVSVLLQGVVHRCLRRRVTTRTASTQTPPRRTTSRQVQTTTVGLVHAQSQSSPRSSPSVATSTSGPRVLNLVEADYDTTAIALAQRSLIRQRRSVEENA
jgi:hypothetical protein